ncbi:MAG: L-rhamnose/proton symporter RhaT, partial [Maribacter sp.]
TYTISIGISAILGTIVPLIMHGTLYEKFNGPGGYVIFLGMFLALIGIILCGVAGYRKENDLKAQKLEGTEPLTFNMRIGLTLTIIAGVLSAVFGISLEVGAPVAEIAGQNGAGHFEGNANLILSTGGAFVTNFVWFLVAGLKSGTLKEIVDIKGIGGKKYFLNFALSILSGALWYGQFFFYGIAHVKMGAYKFASWVIHMSMLIFFSYIVGLVMKEWTQVTKRTYMTLLLALGILIISFVVMTYGSMLGAENGIPINKE